jgi:hypothetical protein
MSEGKDQLIGPASDWVPDYPVSDGHRRTRVRRRRRRLSPRARRDHRRLLRTAALCSIVLLAMIAGLYMALSQGEHNEGSAAPRSMVRSAPA